MKKLLIAGLLTLSSVGAYAAFSADLWLKIQEVNEKACMNSKISKKYKNAAAFCQVASICVAQYTEYVFKTDEKFFSATDKRRSTVLNISVDLCSDRFKSLLVRNK